ncbi:MAG: diguanylate cyclase [Oscillospiraceae bacterium]|nr:diguanylate cyclase [Oscillospiraceae bacterium]
MISRLKDTLLLVGDAESDRASLRDIFEASFDLLEAENVSQALMLLDSNIDCICAVLADIPLADGDELRALSGACLAGTEHEVPIIIFVSPDARISEDKIFSLGATNVVNKPYSPAVILHQTESLIDLYLHKWHLQKLVAEQSEAIRNTNQVMVDALSTIIEHRSTESGNHVMRIRRFTKVLLENIAKNCPEYGLTDYIIDSISGASALHDIGKVSIPDAILNKPGRLTEEEFEVMKTHSVVGSELIQHLSSIGDVEYLRYAYNIALYHHERWDGGGYPYGLKGDEIPICAQVVGLADAFDALTTHRVYKSALSYNKAINMILNGECGVFSPILLECFKNTRSKFVELAHKYADGYSPKDDAISLPLPGPNWKNNSLNTAQISHVKYQTILHYLNDTVMELDLDINLCHVVFNPNPDLDNILPHSQTDGLHSILKTADIHPEDAGVVDEINRFIKEDFFRLNLRRKAFACRIFSPTSGDYMPYELIFLRVNTGDGNRKQVLAIWHRLYAALESLGSSPARSNLHSSPALYGLVSSALRCNCDNLLTIDSGSSDLYHLTGYTSEEIEQVFGGCLLNMVLEKDKGSLFDSLQVLFTSGGKSENEFRILRKNADPLWVLAKSRKYIENDGQEYIYLAIRDNARGKAIEQELKYTMKRNQTIIDQSGGIVFEWDIGSDTMYCSPRWAERFGYMPVSKNYGSQMGIATHFHPDDLPLVRDAISELKTNLSSLSLDVRIADVNAKYLWTRIIATAHTDDDGNLVKIIGILQDIDSVKHAELALKERAERDSLTKLLNKLSTQELVSENLTVHSTGTSAILLLDLDNFKAINDNFGHLYGDSILAQVGLTLKRLFRANDIIGRVGGDEFLIYFKDIPGYDLVHNRCQQLLETFRLLFEESTPGANASCSIGVALVPEHGKNYTELFRKADEALYISKKLGKNRYSIYNPDSDIEVLVPSDRAVTNIDSDEQPGMADASFVRYTFRKLYDSTNITETINEILAYVGQQLNVSRVYIFENNDDNTCCSNTFEWCGRGIEPEIDNLQNISYITDIAGWPDVFDENGVFCCSDISSLQPHFRAILEPQNIKSMLQCAITDNGIFRGYVGFDECAIHRMWSQEQINMLQFLSEVLVMFLLKKRSQDKAIEQARSLRSILDQQDAWIYVIDPDTFTLKFLNANAKALAHDSKIGDVCYHTLMGREERCMGCPAVDIRKNKNAVAGITNPKFGVRARARAAEIDWEGSSACLMTCHELPKSE